MKDMLLVNEITEALIENESLILPRAAPKKSGRAKAIPLVGGSLNSKTPPRIQNANQQRLNIGSSVSPGLTMTPTPPPLPSTPSSSSSVPVSSGSDKRPLPKPRSVVTTPKQANSSVISGGLASSSPVSSPSLSAKEKPRPQPPLKKPLPPTTGTSSENHSEEEDEPAPMPPNHVRISSTNTSIKYSNSPQDEIASLRSEFNLRLNSLERQFTQRINTLEKDLIKERKLRKDLEEQVAALIEKS